MNIESLLHDQCDGGDKKVDTEIDLQRNRLSLSFDGYEDMCGNNALVDVEVWEGELRVIIWADPEQEDPTHIVSLEKCAIK